MKRIGIVVMVLTVATNALSQWPQYHNDKHRSGQAQFGVQLGNEPKHDPIPVEAGTPLGPPIISGGVVYVGSANGKLHAINLNSFAPKWTLDRGSLCSSSVRRHHCQC
jgi:outer membrane protein assembly factor BamB